MEDNEIIKALECCGALDKGCQKCLYNETFGSICIHFLCKDALDLINRLQEENKKNENIIKLADKTIETANAEIERLKEEICIQNKIVDERGKEVLRHDRCIRTLHKKLKTAKAEAYKEFAERLKMRAINRYNEYDNQEFPYATITHIDNLLKELVGDSQ